MSLNLQPPILYLITSGATTEATTTRSDEFQNILRLVRAATRARIPLIQLREKRLQPNILYELTVDCALITQGTRTRLLVNDRADIARAARADGVHLTARSIEAPVIRSTFGSDFLIGVSTHSIEEAKRARDGGADFVVFGPVFATPSKRDYGQPLGLARLHEVAQALSPFPLLAIGGITKENAPEATRAGASGIAAIRLFAEPEKLETVAQTLWPQSGER